ncbi:aminopeptidase N [Malonomonas rubra DSM 5091]|uniref:Aminopeptidase N n=1 Tax=Malonomonas rubra DSM 5091 TaxID=1122189 RepID=A0A1M6BPC1_MALRU|nr:aminopeptidase N [Malonomonas rubra]SHI50542.1 aminopeptidase N [Malonomonas rubra DSM 5091]
MAANTKAPEAIHLEDYKTPAYLVDQVQLTFQLEPSATLVRSKLQMSRNLDRTEPEPLRLDGNSMELISVVLDGKTLSGDNYQLDAEGVTIFAVPEKFCLEIETKIDPAGNTSLEGLYQSSGNFCTQCEAHGFRKITFYPDRPDVMAKFRVRIEAEKKYPVLLSNGNLIAEGELENGHHYAEWEDPFPKPSYLFALVAGDLVCIEDSYKTRSGRDVLLQIFVEERNKDFCDHAMLSLKKSMKWDEDVFDLEYDLDRYMIVAVDDFNMGAMENKGLNVFNSKYVLAHPETATDADYLGVESVIAHEYFHNWTGNRVTCRDWFQLSLKEGLTVYRDQQFSADMNSAAVCRIDDVRILRQHQFPEDAGPMAHPVRPASYVEINNFYTMTVYNKGAEVIRMMRTLLGEEKFVDGVKLYLKRHDGDAATCDDFVRAMEAAGQRDLSQFKLWYSQAGTPQVLIRSHYDEQAKSLRLDMVQHCPPTPEAEQKQPFQIPLAVGLLAADGSDIPLQLEGEDSAGATTRVLELCEKEQSFTFIGLKEQPILSPLRGFSAPVRLKADFSDDELAFRMAHDADSFNRWEAGQTLALKELLRMLSDLEEGRQFVLSPKFICAWRHALEDRQADMSLLTQLLTLPSEQYLSDQLEECNPQAVREVRDRARWQLGSECQAALMERYQECADDGEYSLDPQAVGRRSLRNFCLTLLMELHDQRMTDLCLEQYYKSQNMTDRLAAFAVMVDNPAQDRLAVINDFYQRWQEHPLLIDKWFSVQAMSHQPQVFAEVELLLRHPAFSMSNPNRFRSLVGAFTQNLGAFHRGDGAGYRFLADQVLLLDQKNPQVAARMAGPFTRWKRLEPHRRELMKAELVRMQAAELSKDLYEIVSKSLS